MLEGGLNLNDDATKNVGAAQFSTLGEEVISTEIGTFDEYIHTSRECIFPAVGCSPRQ